MWSNKKRIWPHFHFHFLISRLFQKIVTSTFPNQKVKMWSNPLFIWPHFHFLILRLFQKINASMSENITCRSRSNMIRWWTNKKDHYCKIFLFLTNRKKSIEILWETRHAILFHQNKLFSILRNRKRISRCARKLLYNYKVTLLFGH
jgi:hypothetical protein